MSQSDQSFSIALPEDLQRQFDRLEKRLFLAETAILVGGCATAIAGSYLIVFASDRLWDTPEWLRAVALASGLGLAGWTIARWSKKWIFRRRNDRDLARLVQKKFPRLGDRLLGIVELSSEEKHTEGYSPELYRAAIRQVASESASYDFGEASRGTGARKKLKIGIAGAALAVISFVIFPRAGANAFARLAAPFAEIRRHTLVEIAGLPSEARVPHGEAFKIAGELRYRSFWKPKKISARFERTAPARSAVTDGRFALAVPGQIEQGRLIIRAGDAEAVVHIKPLLRPSLTELTATIDLPEYLQQPPREVNVQGGALSAVEESRATLKGRVSRELAEAHAALENGNTLPVEISGDAFTTATLAIDNIPAAQFTWRDNIGFTNTAPWRLAIQTHKDAEPVPELPDLSRELSILESEVMQIRVRGRDDFGVMKLGLNWDLTNAGITNQPFDFSAEADNSQREEHEHTFTFTPSLLGIPADTTIAVRGWATDYFPGREPIETPSYRIHVLGNEQHAELVRQRLESLFTRLEEVARLQEKIAAATAELKESDAPAADSEAARRANELKEEQLQNAAALKDMSEEGMKTLREALRNPSLSEQSLKDWTKTMKEMQELSKGAMEKAAKSLGEASQNSSESERDEKLAEAEQSEKDALQELEQMQKRVNKGLDDLQAQTLAQRLRKLSVEQKEIHTDLQKVIGETIGLSPEELSPTHRKQNQYLAEQQIDSRDRSETLRGEISRFFERTRKPNYGQVSKEMAGARTADELDRVRNLIEGNVGMQAMDALNLWSDRFAGWAELLEPPKQKGESGGAGQAGGPQEPDAALLQLMALLRLREGQFNLRERTKLLDQAPGDEAAYRENATKLQAGEMRLLQTLDQIDAQNETEEMVPILRDMARSMQGVENLLGKPQTDEVTIAAHNDALEKMTDAINFLNEQQQKSQQQQSAEGQQAGGDEMAFLMQMMQQGQPQPGMQGGMQPGMNMSGGDTQRASNAQTGNATGRADAARAVNKAGGTTASLPAEFRDALEAYFKAVEGETSPQ